MDGKGAVRSELRVSTLSFLIKYLHQEQLQYVQEVPCVWSQR